MSPFMRIPSSGGRAPHNLLTNTLLPQAKATGIAHAFFALRVIHPSRHTPTECGMEPFTPFTPGRVSTHFACGGGRLLGTAF